MNFDNLTSPRKSIHRDNLRREDFLVYGVTDRHWLQEGERLSDVVRKALDGGATFIQLREKQLDEADFMAEALEIQKLCREYDVPFVINDNVKIAAEIGADGVHDARALTMDTLKAITAAVNIPVVAIGGITEENTRDLAGTGIDGVAVISAIFGQKDIETAARRLLTVTKHVVNK